MKMTEYVVKDQNLKIICSQQHSGGEYTCRKDNTTVFAKRRLDEMVQNKEDMEASGDIMLHSKEHLDNLRSQGWQEVIDLDCHGSGRMKAGIERALKESGIEKFIKGKMLDAMAGDLPDEKMLWGPSAAVEDKSDTTIRILTDLLDAVTDTKIFSKFSGYYSLLEVVQNSIQGYWIGTEKHDRLCNAAKLKIINSLDTIKLGEYTTQPKKDIDFKPESETIEPERKIEADNVFEAEIEDATDETFDEILDEVFDTIENNIDESVTEKEKLAENILCEEESECARVCVSPCLNVDLTNLENSSVDLKLSNDNFDGSININIELSDPKNSSIALDYDLDDNFSIGGNIRPNDPKNSTFKLNFKYDNFSIGADVNFRKLLDSTLSGSITIPIYNIPVKFGINLKLSQLEEARFTLHIPLKIVNIKILDVSVKRQIKKAKRIFTHPKRAFHHERKKVRKILKGHWRGRRKKKRRKRKQKQLLEEQRIKQLQYENELYTQNVQHELMELFAEYDLYNQIELLKSYTKGVLHITELKVETLEIENYRTFLSLFEGLDLLDLNVKLEQSLEYKKITFDRFERAFMAFEEAFDAYVELNST